MSRMPSPDLVSLFSYSRPLFGKYVLPGPGVEDVPQLLGIRKGLPARIAPPSRRPRAAGAVSLIFPIDANSRVFFRLLSESPPSNSSGLKAPRRF